MSALCDRDGDSTTGETSQINSISKQCAPAEQELFLRTAQFASLPTSKFPKFSTKVASGPVDSKPREAMAGLREYSPRLEMREQQINRMMDNIVLKGKLVAIPSTTHPTNSHLADQFRKHGFDSPLLNKTGVQSDPSEQSIKNFRPTNWRKDASHYFTKQAKQGGLRTTDSEQNLVAVNSESFRIRGTNAKRRLDLDSAKHEISFERATQDHPAPTVKLFDQGSFFQSQSSKYIKKLSAPAFARTDREDDRSSASNCKLKSLGGSTSRQTQLPLQYEQRKYPETARSELNKQTKFSLEPRYSGTTNLKVTSMSKSNKDQACSKGSGSNMLVAGRPVVWIAADEGNEFRIDTWKEAMSIDGGPCQAHPLQLQGQLNSRPVPSHCPESGSRLRPKVSFDKLLLGRQRSGNSTEPTPRHTPAEKDIKMTILINRPKLQSQGMLHRDEELIQSIPLSAARRMDRKLIGSEIMSQNPVKAFHGQMIAQHRPLLNTFLKQEQTPQIVPVNVGVNQAVSGQPGPAPRGSSSGSITQCREPLGQNGDSRLAKQQHRVMSLLFGQKNS